MNGAKISLTEAMEVTGLAASTLERFIEAGYLKAIDNQGNVFIDATGLIDTFGVEISNLNQEPVQKVRIGSQQPALSTQPEVIVEDNSSIHAKVVDLQERLLQEKDSVIKEQASEIQWLRERIEKLETQSEKDKVLLLSSNQTISQLIELQNKTHNPLRRALSWFGKK